MPDERDPRAFFSAHHHAYVVSPGHAHGRDLDRLVIGLAPKPGERAVDVATGAGHTALRLAEHGAEVNIVDITHEMLEDALTLAQDRHLNLTAVEAPAEALPFSDKSFDLVTCRRAAHHFTDIAQFLSEAHRILRTGGRLGISDMTGSQTGIPWLIGWRICGTPRIAAPWRRMNGMPCSLRQIFMISLSNYPRNS